MDNKKMTTKKKKNNKKEENGRNATDVENVLTELKTPFSVIADAVKLLIDIQKDKHDEQEIQLLDTIQGNLDRINAILDGLMANKSQYEDRSVGKFIHFDLMNQIQQVCATHDILFLQKQIHYHISASADLPKVYANPEQILLVLSNLISNAVKYAPRGSDIDINVKEVSLRQGAGVEVTIINASEDFTERDRYHIFEQFYKATNGTISKSSGLGLSVCRQIIQQAHGQLWVDIPTKGKVAFAFVLPCAEIKEDAKPLSHHTFKYDITIANYENIKSRFGAQKSQNLLLQIEDYVRNLVRYPIDVVTAFEQSGIVSTIYETQEGNASSVAARISKKLGSERFQLGKDQIDLTFQYRLSALQ